MDQKSDTYDKRIDELEAIVGVLIEQVSNIAKGELIVATHIKTMSKAGLHLAKAMQLMSSKLEAIESMTVTVSAEYKES